MDRQFNFNALVWTGKLLNPDGGPKLVYADFKGVVIGPTS